MRYISRPDWWISDREATPESHWLDRRNIVAAMLAAGLLPAAAGAQAALKAKRSFTTAEDLTPLAAVTSYNNFYEFGLDKDDPARNAGTLRRSRDRAKRARAARLARMFNSACLRLRAR